MRNILLVDVHNFYVNGMKKFDQTVNYPELACLMPFYRKIAYGRQSEDKVQTFAKMLKGLNYEVRFGGSPYNVEMALTVAELIERRAVDHLVIGSSYFETIHIHEYCFNRGVTTTALGFNIPEAFGRFADIVEMDHNLLMDFQDEVPVESVEQVVAA